MFAPVKPLVALTLAVTCGATAGALARPAPIWPLALGVVGLAMAGRARARATAGVLVHRAAGPALELLLVALALGLLMSALAWQRLAPSPWPATSPRWVVVEGTVDSDPRPSEKGVTFYLRARGSGRHWRAGEVIWVSAWAGEDRTWSDGVGAFGATARVAGFMGVPDPPSNPGEFDFARYLAAAGVRYTLRARAVTFVDRPTAGSGSGTGLLTAWVAACRSTRDRLVGSIEEGLPPNQAALLTGLLFGDTSRLPEATARDFRRSGVYHILAVSGSNVAFVAGGFWLVARPVLGLAGLRGRRRERPLLVLTGLVLAAYAAMAGLGPSVVRATLMGEAGLLYLWLGRRRDIAGPLCLAALVMLVRRPLVVLDVGFQLSFAATLGILFIYPTLWRRLAPAEPVPAGLTRKLLGGLAQAGAVSLAAQATVVPILAHHFGEVSLAGLVANLVVVPLSGLAVTLGLGSSVVALAGAPGGAASSVLFLGTSLLLEAITGSARLFARLPLAAVVTGAPPVWSIALYYLGLVWIIAGARTGRAFRRWLVTACLATALILSGLAGLGPGGAARSGPEITFLAVGQGDAIYLRLPSGTGAPGSGWSVLVDTGPPGAGERFVAPFLRHRGVAALDAIILTHFHDDHCGGLVELLNDPGLRVGALFIPERRLDLSSAELPTRGAVLEAARGSGVAVRQLSAGHAFSRSGTGGEAWRLAVLWPPPGAPADPSGSSTAENDASLVLRLEFGGWCCLLAGDLEATGEEALLGAAGPRHLDSMVLKVGHHGSAYSSGSAFLEAVDPAAAVVSVGPNTFGHPSPLVLARLAAAGSDLFITLEDGAVQFRPAGGGAWRITTYRSRRTLTLDRPEEAAGCPDPAEED